MKTCYVFGGPNGAGKTTLALRLLPALGCRNFVNADLIASGLSPLDVSLANIAAGRLMLQRLDELSCGDENFGFETTFASGSATKLLERMAQKGWRTHLHYIWLSSAELAVARVQARVKAGGHFIEETTIRRRYVKGLHRFRSYMAEETEWTIYDNSGKDYEVIARRKDGFLNVMQPEVWREVVDAR